MILEQRIENREQRIENREQRIENREQRIENREQRIENREVKILDSRDLKRSREQPYYLTVLKNSKYAFTSGCSCSSKGICPTPFKIIGSLAFFKRPFNSDAASTLII